jgi:hypothetical protein
MSKLDCRTQIPGGGPDDWSAVLDGKEIIGRIYRAPHRAGDPWFWGLNAPSLDSAKGTVPGGQSVAAGAGT